SQRRSIERVRISAQAAARAPRKLGPTLPTGELDEIGFPQNHRSSLPKPLDGERVAARSRAGKRGGSRGGEHLVGRVEVVFDQDRDAVQQTADALCAAFAVE